VLERPAQERRRERRVDDQPRPRRPRQRAQRAAVAPTSRSRTALLRSGGRTAWLEIVLDEGRNRQIRRLLGAFDIEVLRLIRVAIGGLQLGELAKGQARHLTSEELAILAA